MSSNTTCNDTKPCPSKEEMREKHMHKDKCKPYKVDVSDKMGRFIVSTRDIKPGEIILQESPIVIGPTVDSSLLCLGCHRLLQKWKFCTTCGVAPVCSVECQLQSYHAGEECDYYRKSFKNFPKDFISSNIQLVTLLRCLMLKERRKDLWERFINLESHLENRQNDPVWQFYQEKIFNILKPTNILNSDDRFLIQKISAILDINSFELRGPAIPAAVQGERLRGIYLQAALMSHDCISNTHLSVNDNFTMTIRASVPIARGTPVLFNYASPFESTAQRLQRLKEGKYFSCTCKRCSDPTELGTYMGSILCPVCHIGFVISTDPLLELSNFFCNNCNHKFSYKLIKTTIRLGWNLVESADGTNCRELELLLNNLLKTFPKTGTVVIELKQKYVACLRDLILRAQNPNRSLLKLKINLCEDLLGILNIIEPGLSRLKGITLYELYKPKIILAHKEYEGGNIAAKDFLTALKDCEKILKEAISFLIYEPQNSPEGRLNQIALTEMKILRQDITNVTIMY